VDVKGLLVVCVLVVFTLFSLLPYSIAGFKVGARVCEPGLPDLGAGGTNACYGYRTVAEANLQEAAPSHAPIAATEIYVDPVRVLLGGWGTRAIVVLRLADQTVHAYRVQCGVGIARDTCLGGIGRTKAYPAAP
jgi:hypothetical protein